MDLSVRPESSKSIAQAYKLTMIVGGLGLVVIATVAAAQGSASELTGFGASMPGALGPQTAADNAFWRHWGDGKAELDGYRLVQPRYGQARNGTVVHIFVTEPFSYEARVKADPGRHSDSDVFKVLKLNVVKDFRTGIYDYHTMTSVFVPVEKHGRVRVGYPTKLTFSSQEWCGMLFEELVFEPKRIDQKRFSYFDGEQQDAVLPHPPGGLTVDGLPIALRGLLSGKPLKPGESLEVPILTSVERARLVHRPTEWTRGTIAREKTTQKVDVPAGQFEVDEYTVELRTGERYSFRLESAYPRRVVSWDGPDGEKAELLGSTRLPYWQLNREGNERFLRSIGFEPPAR